mmetsp:Transcript_25206/g.64021  ORF Transcript_25206/g.64021 Transcript_25206/m.64021 type:complete len:303 (-) Transcript_25206:57-965(-)
MLAVCFQLLMTASTQPASSNIVGSGCGAAQPSSGQKPTPVACENCQQLHCPSAFAMAGGSVSSSWAAGQAPLATLSGLHGAVHLPNMLPMQLPLMSGSFEPMKMLAICAGQGLPLPSRKFDWSAWRTYLSVTMPAPHCSGMKMKSLLRYCAPLSVVSGARFQFQNDTLPNELLCFRPSMKPCISGVVWPSCVMPGSVPRRPQPHWGSSLSCAWRPTRPSAFMSLCCGPEPWPRRSSAAAAKDAATSVCNPRTRAAPPLLRASAAAPFSSEPLSAPCGIRASASSTIDISVHAADIICAFVRG